MSAAVAEPPTTVMTPAEYVRRLVAKDRAAMLAELLRDQPVGPVAGPTGESLGYFLPAVPPNQPWPVLTPEEIAEGARRASDTKDKFIPIDDMIAWIRAGMPERSGSPRRDGR